MENSIRVFSNGYQQKVVFGSFALLSKNDTTFIETNENGVTFVFTKDGFECNLPVPIDVITRMHDHWWIWEIRFGRNTMLYEKFYPTLDTEHDYEDRLTFMVDGTKIADFVLRIIGGHIHGLFAENISTMNHFIKEAVKMITYQHLIQKAKEGAKDHDANRTD